VTKPQDLYITHCNSIITKMNNQTKILIHLLNNKEIQFTINQISKDLKINYRIAYQETKKLEEENLIKIQKAGNSNLCSLSNKFNEKTFTAEYERRRILFNKNKDFKIIQNRLSELNFPFITLLFGSYAKGTETKHSDIDLLCVGGNKKILNQVISLIPRDIHLTTITYESFIEMTKSKDLSVVSEANQNNIILIGIEEYYRLIKNAN